jgi:acetyltransferase-like isoleucine patch superfamily enzyme
VSAPGRWVQGELPRNVRAGPGTVIDGDLSFRRFHAKGDGALVIGEGCTCDGVQFAVGAAGKVVIGDACYLQNAVLLAEIELRIGSRVLIGWNVTIADTDFHPLAPAERVADAIALSPLCAGRPRPPIERRPVVVEDDVYVGPGAAILKGVRIGAGAFVEPGAVVTRDVPPRARVAGNPARVVGEV